MEEVANRLIIKQITDTGTLDNLCVQGWDRSVNLGQGFKGFIPSEASALTS